MKIENSKYFVVVNPEDQCKYLKKIPMTINFHLCLSQVALKRQQAVEDAIALRLASNETGKSMESLPPGKIFGMTVTEPKPDSQITPQASLQMGISPIKSIADNFDNKKSDTVAVSSTSNTPIVSQNAIEMLSSLFPHRKRSVLELVLRRCDLDLLR